MRAAAAREALCSRRESMGSLARGELNSARPVRRWAVVAAQPRFLLVLCLLVGGGFPALPETALAGSVSRVVVATSSPVPGQPSTYTIEFVSTSTLPVAATITVDASSGAPGTQFPDAAGDYQLSDATTGVVIKLATVGAAGQKVTITVGTAITAGDSISLIVTPVMNPAVVSTNETLQISTSSDTAQATSKPYSIVVGSLAVDPRFGLRGGANNPQIHLHRCDRDRRDVHAYGAERLDGTFDDRGERGLHHRSVGSVTANGRQISVAGVTLASGDVLTVVYGDGGGANSAVAPATAGSTAFTLSVSVPHANSAIRAISPLVIGTVPVTVTRVTDGVGTITVAPTNVISGGRAMLTFTYRSPVAISGGRLVVTVPSGWSMPSGTPGTAGYTTGYPDRSHLRASRSSSTISRSAQEAQRRSSTERTAEQRPRRFLSAWERRPSSPRRHPHPAESSQHSPRRRKSPSPPRPPLTVSAPSQSRRRASSPVAARRSRSPTVRRSPSPVADSWSPFRPDGQCLAVHQDGRLHDGISRPSRTFGRADHRQRSHAQPRRRRDDRLRKGRRNSVRDDSSPLGSGDLLHQGGIHTQRNPHSTHPGAASHHRRRGPR